MRILRPATVGVALALGVTGAYAQSVVRQIDNEPVETTVIRGPSGTVVTRRPLAAPVAPAAPIASEAVQVGTGAYMDEAVGVAPTMHTFHSTRTVTRVERARRSVRESAVVPRHVVHARSVTRTVRRVAAVRPLMLAPTERRVIYRTIVQQQVIPAVAPTVPVPAPGYPPYPPPAYSERSVMVAPPARAVTTGYAVTTPAADYDNDVYAEAAPPAAVPVRYAVGSRLPAGVALAPVPASVAVAVPAARAYSYARIENRVLLVDPETDTVVADITP